MLQQTTVNTPLTQQWLRAAQLGSLWAANEIVLGSFLHNVSFPLTGTLLASLGVALLVAGVRLWNDHGVIWRAGVICALMKSLSPSAVILGPMVGIVAEALLLYLFASLFRRHAAGLILGGMAATMTPMLQKVVGVLVTYGNDAARLYGALFEVAVTALGLSPLDPLGSVVLLIALSALPGAAAAYAGLLVARRARQLPPPPIESHATPAGTAIESPAVDQKFSLPLLSVHVLVLLAGLTFIGSLPLWTTALFVAGYVSLALVWYTALRRRLAQPRLWTEFAVVALLAGILLGALAPGGHGNWLGGLASGLQMTIRATLVVTAFSAISVELRNPRLVDWFLRRGLGSLSAALEAAFRALPAMTEVLGEQRNLLRHPVASLSRMFAHVLAGTDDAQNREQRAGKVFVLTGEQGNGKTTLLGSLVNSLRAEGLTVGGIRQPVVYRDGLRIGYDVENLLTGTRHPLCRRGEDPSPGDVGPFRFLPDGLQTGLRALQPEDAHPADVMIVDEVGPLELNGHGWASAITPLLTTYSGAVVLVVRSALLPQVLERWDIRPAAIWNMREPFSSLTASHE